MKIYLDTKDLINILEKSEPCSSDAFEEKLRVNCHELVLSYSNIFELSRPMNERRTSTIVTKLLSRIDRMPRVFIRDLVITELEQALETFYGEREYCQISPFAHRFDEIIDSDGPPATRIFLNFGLAETIFTLWTKDLSLFRGYHTQRTLLREVVGQDRDLSMPPSLSEHFPKVILRHLKLYKLPVPSERLKEFSEWIYANPARCPSIRLQFEVYHKLRKNVEDIPKDGDISDFSHVSCIPYIDLITLDRRMASYAKQACVVTGLGYENRICQDVKEVLGISSR